MASTPDRPDKPPAIHGAAARGYACAADSYVRGRPDYPPEVGLWLRDTLGLGADKRVLDLGAGTGKFTPRLVASGAQVVALEPVPAMLERLRAALPQVQAIAGSAGAIPLADASVDAVVCAQSFHWFANARSLAEIHRVLRPRGRLGLVWNQRDARVDWVARLDCIVNQAEGDAPRYHTGAWRAVFPAAGFGPLQVKQFAFAHTGVPEEVILDRVRSTSFIAALPDVERARIEAQVRALIAAEPSLKGQAVVTVPYTTHAFDAVKR